MRCWFAEVKLYRVDLLGYSLYRVDLLGNSLYIVLVFGCSVYMAIFVGVQYGHSYGFGGTVCT